MTSMLRRQLTYRKMDLLCCSGWWFDWNPLSVLGLFVLPGTRIWTPSAATSTWSLWAILPLVLKKSWTRSRRRHRWMISSLKRFVRRRVGTLCGWPPQPSLAKAGAGAKLGRLKFLHLLPFQVAPKAGLAAVAPSPGLAAAAPPPPAKAAAQVQAVEMRAQEMQAVPAKTSPPPPKIGGVQMSPPVMATVAKSGSANQVPPLTLGVPFAPLPSVPPPVPMIGGETGGQHHAPPPAEPVEPRAAEGFGEGENVEGETSLALTSASLGAVAKAGALPVPTDIAEPVPEAERTQDDELLEAELEQVFDEAVAADGAEAPADKVICGICRDEIKQGEAANSAEEAVLALECSHVYHQMCLSKTWSIGGWPRGWCPQRCLDHILLENRGGAGGVEIVIDGPAGSGPAPPAPPPRPSALSSRNGCGGVSVHRVSIMVPPAEAASETVVVDGENVALWAELRKADCNSILIWTVIVSQICTIWIIAVFVMPGSCQSYLCNCWFCTFCCQFHSLLVQPWMALWLTFWQQVCLAVCRCLFDVDQTHRRQHVLTDPDLDFDCLGSLG